MPQKEELINIKYSQQEMNLHKKNGLTFINPLFFTISNSIYNYLAFHALLLCY